MNLFLSLLPFYIFGNLHCAGMCGPLVMLLTKYRYRYFYFLGRLISFALAGLLAAELGFVFQTALTTFHIPSFTALLFGMAMVGIGVITLLRWRFPGKQWLAQKTAGLSMRLATLMGKDQMWPTFLFGFFTLLLPCGQTIVVFSACAMDGNPLTGLANGFLFALLTSPSLVASLHSVDLFKRLKKSYHWIWGGLCVGVGLLACLRGLADFDLISHYSINIGSSSRYHIILF